MRPLLGPRSSLDSSTIESCSSGWIREIASIRFKTCLTSSGEKGRGGVKNNLNDTQLYPNAPFEGLLSRIFRFTEFRKNISLTVTLVPAVRAVANQNLNQETGLEECL